MQFKPLEIISGLFSKNSKRYTRTPMMPQMQMVSEGQPEWLSPESWDAYEIYMTTAELYAVIQRKGYLLSSGEWMHKNKDGVEIENSEFVKLLNNPNPLMNGKDYIRQWSENKCIYGNNFEYLNRPVGFDIPNTITNLQSYKVEIKTTGKYYKQDKIEDIIKAYQLVFGNDTMDTFEPSEINHTRIPNGQNPVKGDSPMRALFMVLSNIRSAYAFRNVIMNKKGALGILSNDAKSPEGAIPITSKERDRLEKAYQRSYGVDDEQLQVIMSNSALKWQAMSYPTKDLMLFEEVDADFRAIIDAYGLNDNIFSREKGSTFTNLAEGLKQAYQQTIIPEAKELALNRTKIFGLQEKGEYLELNYDHIPVLQMDLTKEAERLERIAKAAKTMQESLIFTNEEIRSVLNLD